MSKVPAPDSTLIERAVAVVGASVDTAWERLSRVLNDRRMAVTEALAAAVEAGVQADPTQEAADYARTVLHEVLAPVARALRGKASAQNVVDTWEAGLQSMGAAAAALPQTRTRGEPELLYRRTQHDSLWIRTRKADIRVRRWVWDTLGSPVARFRGTIPPPRLQVVPVRTLGTYHLTLRVPRLVSSVVDRALRDPARPVTHLERAFTEWAHELLDEDEETGPPSEEERITIHRKLLDRLTHARELARQLTPPKAPDLEGAGRRFVQDLGEAGTFLLDRRPLRPERMAKAVVSVDSRWVDFYDRAANRLDLAQDLIQLRHELDGQLRTFERTIDAAAASVTKTLTEAGNALESAAPAPGEALAESSLDRIAADTSATVRHLHSNLADPVLKRTVQKAADTLAEGLTRATRALPPVYHCQELQDTESFVLPAGALRDYRAREVAETAFDAIAIEQIRAVAVPLAAHCEAAAACPAELTSILDFNLAAAKQDLSMEEPGPGDALALVRGGIEAAVAVTRDAAQRLEAGIKEEFPAAHQAMSAAWGRLHGRIRIQDQRQDELLGAWTTLRSWGRLRIRAAQATVQRWEDNARRRLERWRRVILRLLRRGQKAVLQPQVSDADVERTLVAIQDVDQLTKNLPIVYQRLFALAPVADPDLVVGRDDAFRRVAHFRRRWERGVAPILAVTAPDGIGKTTFLNVLEQTVFQDCCTVRVPLDARLSNAEQFFAEVLEAARGAAGPPHSEHDQDGQDPAHRSGTKEEESPEDDSHENDGLVQSSQKAFTSLQALGEGKPVVVIVEPAEHLFSRRVGGAQVMDGVLTQLRQSPLAVWWILSASSYAWALLEKLEPSASTLATRLELKPLERKYLSEAILRRHQKSGLPLHFEAPDSLPRRLQTEAKRATNEEGRQRVYAEDYFDRLDRLSAGDITRAMFHWLRSLELDRNDRQLRVRTTPPLNFGFLSELDLARTFALKSFLDHGSLTPEEHADITGDALQRSLVLFESLFGLRLIRPNSSDPSASPHAVAPGERYSIHPLTARPIVEFLIAQRIVH